MDKNKIYKQILSVSIRIVVSAILLFILFQKVDKKSLFDAVKTADKELLFVAFFVFLFNYFLCIFRWEMLLKAAKMHLSFRRVVISSAGGFFFNLFLPSSIGGDLVRSIDLSVHTKRPHEIVATVLVDRLSGYIGMVMVAVLALSFGWKLVQDTSVLVAVGIITLILVVALAVIFNRRIYVLVNRLLHNPKAGKIRSFIKTLHSEMHIFRNHADIAVDNILVSLVIQAITPVCAYLVALSLGAKVGLHYFFIFVPIIVGISMLPVSIGGLGLRDAAAVFFFVKAGMPKDIAFAMSLLIFFFTFVYGLIGGLIYVFTLHHRRLQYNPPYPFHQHPQKE